MAITCKNCGNQFEGKYCNSCSQPADTDRISWKEVIHHLPHALFHADGGLFYTIREMVLRPGYTIKAYIEGKRIHHFNPFLFLLLLGGLLSLMYLATDIKLLNKEIDLMVLKKFSPTLAHKYFGLIGLQLILLLTITDYIVYYNHRYNFPELVTSNTFQAGQIVVFLIAIFPLFLLQRYLDQKYGFFFPLRRFVKAGIPLYLFVVRYQLYGAKGNHWVIVKIILQLAALMALYHFVITPTMARML